MKTIHRLSIPLQFPHGVAPGEGSDYNVLRVARSGGGDPVLRGTALVGALRHAWRRRELALPSDQDAQTRRATVDAREEYYFGHAASEDDRAASKLTLNDAVLRSGQATGVATHHRRSRHTGAVAGKALYSIESCPKDTTANVTLWLTEDDGTGGEFLAALLGILQSHQTLGGKAARGFGDVQVDMPRVAYRQYQLPDDYGSYLDDHRRWRAAPDELLDGEPLAAAGDARPDQLVVRLELGVPRGQDILLGDGQGLDHEIEPESIAAADGTRYWRLRGSAIRGILRAWFTRLAARESPDNPHAVADNVARYQQWRADVEAAAGGGKPVDPYYRFEENGPEANCPVYALFGSPSSRGRIHVTNAYARCSNQEADEKCQELQTRMHVAVDRVTGGAAESMLFENTVLTSELDAPFGLTIRVDACQDHEANWLARTLTALHLGILRVGSSKSSGRLEIRDLHVDPPHAEAFTKLQAMIGR